MSHVILSDQVRADLSRLYEFLANFDNLRLLYVIFTTLCSRFQVDAG